MGVDIKIVKLLDCTVAGGYQTDIENPNLFYNFTGDQMKAIFSLSKETASYFFTGSKAMHIFGGKVDADKQVEDWMIKREIPEAEYVYFYNSIKEDEPYDEDQLIKETWAEVNNWMDNQSDYVWSDNEDIPNMIVASTEKIGYNLYKAIKKA